MSADATVVPVGGIRLEGVSKRYRIGRQRWHVGYLCSLLFPDGPRRWEARPRPDSFLAIDHVDLEIDPGSTVGIIGSNGAGKTTILSLIAGTVSPTEGRVRARGRIGSLIQLAAGFHPDLSGRENIFLYSAILGLSRAAAARRFDEIVEFSGLERFLDTPIKRYSTGMVVRLGYSVAVHLDPEILLVDEVLSVGDLSFAEKCMNHIESLRRSGRTVVVVSHNLPQIETVCRRVLWLDGGRIRADGAPGEVISAYIDAMDRLTIEREQEGRKEWAATAEGGENLKIEGVDLLSEDGHPIDQIPCLGGCRFRIRYRALRPIERPHFEVTLTYLGRDVLQASMSIDGGAPDVVHGEGAIELEFPSLPLTPKSYEIRVLVYAADGVTMITPRRPCGRLRVVPAGPVTAGQAGPAAASLLREAPPVFAPHKWRVEM